MLLGLRILVQLARVFGSMYLPPPGLSWRRWHAVKRAAKHDLAGRTYQRGLQVLLVHAPSPATKQALEAAYAAVYSQYAITGFGPLAPYFPGQEEQIPAYGKETSTTPGDESAPAERGRADQQFQAPQL
jgi:hypothetical protein